MNREIKFKAWHKSKKMMLEVELIYFGIEVVELINENGTAMECDFDEVELMQFTGLKDKNGVEVYEGDYLLDRWEEDGQTFVNRSPVVWDSEDLQWGIDASFRQDGSFLVPIVEYFGNDIEVSGNRFDNPEML